MKVRYIKEESWKGFEKGKVYQAQKLNKLDCWIVYSEKCKVFVRGSKWAVYVCDHQDCFDIVSE